MGRAARGRDGRACAVGRGLALPALLVLGAAPRAARREPARTQPATAVVAATPTACPRRCSTPSTSRRPTSRARRRHAPTRRRPRPAACPRTSRPVSVVVCMPGGTLHDTSGTWSAVTASRREGDLDAARRRRCDGRRRRGAARAAPRRSVPPALWLVDALGRAMRPTWPTDRCGAPAEDGDARRSTRSRRPTASSTRSAGAGRGRDPRPLSPTACAGGRAGPRGPAPWSARASARLRVGRMFCSRLGALIESQIALGALDRLVVGQRGVPVEVRLGSRERGLPQRQEPVDVPLAHVAACARRRRSRSRRSRSPRGSRCPRPSGGRAAAR